MVYFSCFFYLKHQSVFTKQGSRKLIFKQTKDVRTIRHSEVNFCAAYTLNDQKGIQIKFKAFFAEKYSKNLLIMSSTKKIQKHIFLS